ncbi:MAG TPA: aminotransferase class V-fold PLP-dependent enzyme [Puia sp.]|nr:aminotransferase class V-fold PLP-dependent enzyme [Puia sp.]
MDLLKIRKETPGCHDKIFLDSAGSSLPPRSVLEKMDNYLHQEELLGGYETDSIRAKEINEFYLQTALLLNCKPVNIAFAYNATDAYARALSAIPFKQGDYILTTNDDYISNQIAFLSLQKRFGIKPVRANNLENGDIDLEHFEAQMRQYDPVLVAVTHIPTNSGLVQDVEAIGKICERYEAWYLVDACQSVGQMPVDVKKIGCDFLSATGRKFLRGPRGTGFLYVSDEVLEYKLEPLFIDMRGANWVNADEYEMLTDAKRFEMWEFPYAALVGLTEAIGHANRLGLSEIYSYNKPLVQNLREGLMAIGGVQVLDKGSVKSNIVTFHKSGMALDKLKAILKNEKIYFSISLRENARIDFDKKKADWAIRLSPHYFNTKEEIENALHAISEMKE